MRSINGDVASTKGPMPERSIMRWWPKRAGRPGIAKERSPTRWTADSRCCRASTALTILRLEDGDEDAVRHSVALTESFIADMDAQMREEGFGDPSLGKQVRSMVGALAHPGRPVAAGPRRTMRLERRGAVQRLSRLAAEAEAALTFSTEALRRVQRRGLSGISDRELLEGRIG